MPARRKAATCRYCGYTEQDKRIHGDHYLCKGSEKRVSSKAAYRPSKAQVEAAVKVFMQALHPDASLMIWMRRALVAADKVRVEETGK